MDSNKDTQKKKRLSFKRISQKLRGKKAKEPEPQNVHAIVSAIDHHKLPPTHRRLQFLLESPRQSLGIRIENGISIRTHPVGLHSKVSIFVKEIIPGGLVERSRLLSVGDEIRDVNGVDTTGKTVDQVADMFIANYRKLTMTIKLPHNKLPYYYHGHGDKV